MSTYGVIYEQASDGSWSASATDLPVFACGDTRGEAQREIQSAIAFYLQHLRAEGEPIPEPKNLVGTVSV
jgi:predicted RNase H-like HicB family nuclease